MQLNSNVCSEFWKDVKILRKKIKIPELQSTYDDPIFNKVSEEEKIESITLISKIETYIKNIIYADILDKKADKHNKQPFLQKGWIVYKLRYAIDNQGQSGGLRIIFAIDNCKRNILLVLIARKKDCSNENKLISDFTKRIKHFISP